MISIKYNYNLNQLPNLPNTLKKLICSYCGLTSLPKLSIHLIRLYCMYNELSKLPKLPNELEILYCNNNNLTSLPLFPKSIKNINIQCNNIRWISNISEKLSDYCYYPLQNNFQKKLIIYKYLYKIIY